MRHLFAIGAAALLLSTAAFAADPTGSYSVEGTNPGAGSRYSGTVTVDGIDVRTLRLADLRANIAVVSQDPVLFNDTIYNNLLLGRAGASRPRRTRPIPPPSCAG